MRTGALGSSDHSLFQLTNQHRESTLGLWDPVSTGLEIGLAPLIPAILTVSLATQANPNKLPTASGQHTRKVENLPPKYVHAILLNKHFLP